MKPTPNPDRMRGFGFLAAAAALLVVGTWAALDPSVIGIDPTDDTMLWIVVAVFVPIICFDIGMAVHFFRRARRTAS